MISTDHLIHRSKPGRSGIRTEDLTVKTVTSAARATVTTNGASLTLLIGEVIPNKVVTLTLLIPLANG